MPRRSQLGFDEIGDWSELKLEIIGDYAKAYSIILSAQEKLRHIYVDAFSGCGVHESKTDKRKIKDSPLVVLDIDPPFDEYHFIDKNPSKVEFLRKQVVGSDRRVIIYEGDCNQVLIEEILPKIRYDDYRRGLCLLDPYGLDLDWNVIQNAGKMGTVDLVLNFPVCAMNRSVFWENPEGVAPRDIERMNRFWGDETWRGAVYFKEDPDLFGFEATSKTPGASREIVKRFRDRLKKKASFEYVPDPIPMKNPNGGIIYYLFIASPKKAGERIAKYIFNKFRKRMAS